MARISLRMGALADGTALFANEQLAIARIQRPTRFAAPVPPKSVIFGPQPISSPLEKRNISFSYSFGHRGTCLAPMPTEFVNMYFKGWNEKLILPMAHLEST